MNSSPSYIIPRGAVAAFVVLIVIFMVLNPIATLVFLGIIGGCVATATLILYLLFALEDDSWTWWKE